LEHDHDLPVVEHGPTSLDNLPDRCHPCHVRKTKADRARRRERRLTQTSTGRVDRAPPAETR
jgi:hypothetical protein